MIHLLFYFDFLCFSCGHTLNCTQTNHKTDEIGMPRENFQVARVRKTFRALSGGYDYIPVVRIRKELMERQEEFGLDELQVHTFLERSDKNSDGRINMEEFEQIMAKGLGQTSRMRKIMINLGNTVIARNQRLEMTSYLDQYTFWPPPIFIILISMAQLITFFSYYILESPGKNLFFACPGCFRDKEGTPGDLVFAPVQSRTELWRFITYQFVNQGVLQMVVRIVVQLMIGLPLEIVHKFWRIAPIYLLAVLSGAMLQYAFDPSAYVIGNSAGLYSLLFAHAANLCLNWESMPHRGIRSAAIIIFIVYDILSVIAVGFFGSTCELKFFIPQIAGCMTGFFFGFCILYPVIEKDWQVVARAVAVTFYIFYLGELFIFNFVRDPMPPKFECDTSVLRTRI